MKNLSIDGINLNFLDINPDKEKTLLFLHGNSHSLKTFSKQIGCENLNQYRLILWDIPGHGESSRDGNYSLKHFADILSKFIQELNLEKVIVVGHSLGGHLAINLLKYTRPLGLVLFGTPPLNNPFDPAAFLPNTNAPVLQQAQSSGQEIENLMKEMGYTGDDLIQATQDYLRTDPRFRSEILAEVISGTNENELALVKSFANDLLILLATNDTLINNNYILNELKGMKNLEVVSIAAGHSPHIEVPKIFNQILAGFSEKVFDKDLSAKILLNNRLEQESINYE